MYTFLKSSHQAGSNHMKKPYCVFLPLIPGFAPEWLICPRLQHSKRSKLQDDNNDTETMSSIIKHPLRPHLC